MKVYITKWALTKGILVAEAEQVSKEHVVVKGAVPWQDFRFGLGDWHVDRDRAITRAEQMRAKKYNQLVDEANRMGALTFEVPDLV